MLVGLVVPQLVVKDQIVLMVQVAQVHGQVPVVVVEATGLVVSLHLQLLKVFKQEMVKSLFLVFQ